MSFTPVSKAYHFTPNPKKQCVACGAADAPLFQDACQTCSECEGQRICLKCVEKKTGCDEGTICLHCGESYCRAGDADVIWCEYCHEFHHYECATLDCCDDGEPHEGNIQDYARVQAGDTRSWLEAKREESEVLERAKEGDVAYLVKAIGEGILGSLLKFSASWVMEEFNRTLPPAAKKKFQSWVVGTLASYSACYAALFRPVVGAAEIPLRSRVTHSGQPHLSRLIVSYLVHRKKEARAQVRMFARIVHAGY